MFRPMRRKRQQLSDAETIEILKRGKQGILGLNGDDGYPYAVPVNYAYSNGKIIFHGAKSGYKYDCMVRDDRVAFTVIDKDDVIAEELTTYFRSVMVFGRVRIIEDPAEIRSSAYIFGMKYWDNAEGVKKEIEREFKGLACFEITIEHMTGKEAIELTRARQEA